MAEMTRWVVEPPALLGRADTPSPPASRELPWKTSAWRMRHWPSSFLPSLSSKDTIIRISSYWTEYRGGVESDNGNGWKEAVFASRS